MRNLASLGCLATLVAFVPLSHNQSAAPPAPPGEMPAQSTASLLQEDKAAGLELWQTLLGRLWIPRPGNYVIKHLEWEQKIQKVYYHPLVHVRRGDIVIDCGAHIGGFTRVALESGARLVVAIEPEKMNLEAFRRNLAAELKVGRVRLVEKGVWNTTGKLSLHVSGTGDSHSVVVPQSGSKDEIIEVIALDRLIENLKLSRVDFIKMDIEGAEQNALRGSRQVLQRWKPRLAISSYHLKGDAGAISTLVWEYRPDYLVNSKDLVQGVDGLFFPKVLFFH